MEQQEKPMDVYEAAWYLRLAPGTLKNKARAGEVPYHKPAGKMYFYASELDAWIKGETKTEK